VEKGVGNGAIHGETRPTIEDMGSSSECLGPITGRHVSVNEEGATDIIQFRFAEKCKDITAKAEWHRRKRKSSTCG
jgi:hypothetical protein